MTPDPALNLVAPFRRYSLFRALPLAGLAAFGVIWAALDERNHGLYTMVATLAITTAIATYAVRQQQGKAQVPDPIPWIDCVTEPPGRTFLRGLLEPPFVLLLLLLEIPMMVWGDPTPLALLVGVATGSSLVLAFVIGRAWWTCRRRERASGTRMFIRVARRLTSGRLGEGDAARLFVLTPMKPAESETTGIKP